MIESAASRDPPLPGGGAANGRRERGTLELALGLCAFAVLYVVTGRLGLHVVAVSGFATPVWAPSGLSLAALLWFGHAAWPAVALAAFVVNIGEGASIPLALAIAAGNTLEAAAGAALLRRGGFSPKLERIRDVALLVSFAAVCSTLVSACVGVAALWLSGELRPGGVPVAWITWWIGDALGVLVVAPLLLVWSASRPRLDARRLIEAALVLAMLVAASALIFSDVVSSDHTGAFRQAYVVFPILTYAAIRLGHHGTTLATALTSCFAIAATALGFGPFTGRDLNESLLLLQVFMGVLSVTMLLLAAAVKERNRAIDQRALALVAETAARRRAEGTEERVRFLDQASRVLSASLEYRHTLQSMAELVVPGVADWCAVEIVEPNETIALSALAHADLALVERVRRIRQAVPYDPDAAAGVPAVIRTGRPELHEVVSEDVLRSLSATPEQAHIYAKLGLRSTIIVPLIARERALGAIVWATAESNRRFSEPDLALAQELARRAAVAIDNARLFEQAQDAIQAREQFLSIASHELRTPLAALTLQVQSLTRSDLGHVETTERQLAKLQLIDRQVARLTNLVDNLLDVSRVVSGRLLLEREPFDLRKALDEVLERFAEQLAKSDCRLVLDAEPSCVGTWDRFRLEQIITNLLSNAIKYGRGGEVRVRLYSEGQHAVLAVKDSGIGIARADQVRIFERFERAVSHRNFGGLGLGLWITKQLVVASGGTISLQSELGQGAEFSVTLPKEPDTSVAALPKA